MKKTFLILSCVALGLISCNKTEATTETSTSTEAVAGGQEAVVDEDSAPTIVKLAAGNKDEVNLSFMIPLLLLLIFNTFKSNGKKVSIKIN